MLVEMRLMQKCDLSLKFQESYMGERVRERHTRFNLSFSSYFSFCPSFFLNEIHHPSILTYRTSFNEREKVQT